MAERTDAVSEYMARLRWIWSAYGSPSNDQIAGRTRETPSPLSEEQVDEYLWGASLPETPLTYQVLWRGITGSDGHGPGDEDYLRVLELLRVAVGESASNIHPGAIAHWAVAAERPEAVSDEAVSEYVTCLRRIWVAHRWPSLFKIASQTQGTLFPMSWDEVGEYLRGAAVPESSLMLQVLWRGITGSDGHRPGDEDHSRIFELWRVAVGAPEPTPTAPLPVVPPDTEANDDTEADEPSGPSGPSGPSETNGASEANDATEITWTEYPPPTFEDRHEALPSLPRVVEQAVEVAGYLAAAGIGGIIGNRADAVVVRTASRLFQSVRDRWRSREADIDAALSEDEAVDAAIAAALALDYGLERLEVTGAEQRSDGSWRVALLAEGEALRANVPAGDPADATILIIPT